MRKFGYLITCMLIGTLVGTAHAATDEEKCLTARFKAKGKYEQCVAKWFAKAYATSTFDQSKLSKCREKYAAIWTKLQRLDESPTCNQPRFEDNGNGTVLDNLTGLSWEKKTTVVGSGVNLSNRQDVDNPYSWSADAVLENGTVFSNFLAGTNSSALSGSLGWRLPTFVELMTIISEPYPCASEPCLDAAFGPAGVVNKYWTSTSNETGDSAWSVAFDTGYAEPTFKILSGFARGVRGGL